MEDSISAVLCRLAQSGVSVRCVAKPDLERRVRAYLGDHQLAL
jgi:hypothetical protein